MLRKLLIRTWRGPLPDWTKRFESSVAPLAAHGWEFMIMDDWESFRRRAYKSLGVSIPEPIDTRKPGHYDPALGAIYGDLLSEYDFWGHFNLDCVYGRLHHFLPDAFLENIDIYGNDPGAICGPFTVYRNCDKVNNLFKSCPGWQAGFESPTFTGWDEEEYSRHVVVSALRGEVRFTSGFLQAHDHMTAGHQHLAMTSPYPPVELLKSGALIDKMTAKEIMMYHFNQTRRWPL